MCLALEMAGEGSGWDWDGDGREAPESEEAAEGSVLAVSAGCGGLVGWECSTQQEQGLHKDCRQGWMGWAFNSNQDGCRGWEQLPSRTLPLNKE